MSSERAETGTGSRLARQMSVRHRSRAEGSQTRLARRQTASGTPSTDTRPGFLHWGPGRSRVRFSLTGLWPDRV